MYGRSPRSESVFLCFVLVFILLPIACRQKRQPQVRCCLWNPLVKSIILMKHGSDCGQIAGQIRMGCFTKTLVFPGFSERSMDARRLHKLGHRNVTTTQKTRWLTPAGLCVSTRKFGAFSTSWSSFTLGSRDSPPRGSRPKRLILGPKALIRVTHPK